MHSIIQLQNTGSKNQENCKRKWKNMQFSRDFNSSLSIIEKTSTEKIGKVIEDIETLSPNLA